MSKLSIITINLNTREGLQTTMTSVTRQTFSDFEYIIIDGGSTDGSLELIKEFADRITYWVSEPDKGIYNAINKGIAKATGEYCLFLNSGDYLASRDSLSKLFATSFHEDIIYWNFFLINEMGKKIRYFQPKILTAGVFYNGTINHQSCLIKKTLFYKFGLYDENLKIVSDWLFFTKTIVFGNVSTKHLNLFLTYFDGTGICFQNTGEKEELVKVLFPDWVRCDYERLKKLDSCVWMLNRSEFHPIVKFMFKSLNKLISLFWFERN